jgi:hypothetical protein
MPLPRTRPVKFASTLTIVYGDNGAGKTGYIRILKQACRARGQEAILGNVVLTGIAPPKPTVAIKYRVGVDAATREWTGGDADEFVSCVSIFDTQCAAIYLNERTDPSGIVFDDPVSSLDYQWRSAVARRVVEESRRRQVVVFTHDVVFLLALKLFAEQGAFSPFRPARPQTSQRRGRVPRRIAMTCDARERQDWIPQEHVANR